ncbi:16627_t:CDS:2 [Rhizophagus irregularis]|nr:16627_t:CDS:2 [Rhizophagus irregularis]
MTFTYDKSIEHTEISKFVLYVAEDTTDKNWKEAASALSEDEMFKRWNWVMPKQPPKRLASYGDSPVDKISLYIISFPTTLTTSLPDDALATTPPLRSQRYFFKTTWVFSDGKVRSEEEQEREGVMVIAGLLKDRVDVEKEPAMKKQRIQGYFEDRSNP